MKEMPNQSVMGIDLGTQGMKVIIYDPITKAVTASASSPLEVHSRADGSREQHTQQWLDAFFDCMNILPDSAKSDVVAMGVSGQQHGFVALGAEGEVLAPVKLWCDTATETEAREIIDHIGSELACRSIAGNSVPVGFTASKVLWLKKHRPEQYSKLAAILLPHDYLNFYLTGNQRMEFGDASGTGLMDIRTRQWSPALLSAIDKDRDLRECLPPLIDGNMSCGTLLPTVAEQTGLPTRITVAAGGGDNMMAAIGTGNVREGRLTASLGTSGTLFAFSEKPIVDVGGDLAAFCSSTGGWMPLGCTMNCTVATEQIRGLINVETSDIERIASAVPPGCEGVMTLPFYNGERMPNLPNGKAVIFGLDTENCTQGHLLRSAMEAAAYGLKTALDAFQRNGMKFDEVTLTGGGSKSRVWRQICADVLNLPVRVLAQQENAAFGAALQALWCVSARKEQLTTIADITSDHLTIDTDGACSPSPATTQIYHAAYKEYQALVAALTPLFENRTKDG